MTRRLVIGTADYMAACLQGRAGYPVLKVN